MASYQETGKKIADRISTPLSKLDETDRRDVIDAILFFGQTAKFRCRNNSAYDNFCRICFGRVARLERSDVGLGFDMLHVDSLKENE